jgi:FkbM family methyltransferase
MWRLVWVSSCLPIAVGHGHRHLLQEATDGLDIFPVAGSKFKVPPGKKTVEINIGTNLSPLAASGPEVFLILVEPIPKVAKEVAKKVKKGNKEATVLQMAISNFTGTAVFHVYASGKGQSSSLSRPRRSAWWNKDESAINVSVHTLKELLEAVPEELPIQFLKTDMQGHDLSAIKSAGDAIKRVSKIHSEVYGDGHPTYKGVDNSRTSFLRYMNEMGFCAIKRCAPKGRLLTQKAEKRKLKKQNLYGFPLHEMDCDFVRRGAANKEACIQDETDER